MVMVAGGGSGKKPVAPLSPYSGIGGQTDAGRQFSIEEWQRQQEEERQRKAAEAEARSRAEQERRARMAREEAKASLLPTANIDAPSSAFKARAEQAKQSLGVGGSTGFGKRISTGMQDDIERDPIMRYSRLVRSMGEDKVAKRLADITYMWNAYNRPYNGSNVIAELLFSPYALDEIEQMIKGSRSILFDSGRGRMSREMDINDFAVDIRRDYRVSTPVWKALEEVFTAQEKAEIPTDPVTGFLIMSSFVPGLGAIGWAGKGVKAALGLAKFGGKMQVAMAAVSDLSAQSEASRMAVTNVKTGEAQYALDAAADPLKMNGMTTMYSFTNPSPFREAEKLRESMKQWNTAPDSRDDIIAYQKEWQKNGIGTDLEANGFLDYGWQAIVIDAAQEVTRATFEEQRLAIEEGDAPYWAEVNGDINDPEWQQWMSKREMRQKQNEELQAANPDRYAWFDQAGLPQTKLGLEAFGNRLDRMGHLQAVYGGLLQIAMTMGKTWQATGSAINLHFRQKSDPVYQKLLSDLTAYVDSQDFKIEGDEMWKGKPSKSGEGFARTQIDGGGLKDDPEAKRLMAALDQRQAQLIQDRYDPDYMLTMGYALGGDFAEVRQYGLDHPDVVRAFTTGVDIVTAKMNPFGKAYRATVKPKIAPSVSAFTNSARSKMLSGRVATYLLAKDAGRAISYVKGTSAAAVVNDLWHITGKKQTRIDPKSKIITTMAREIVDAVDDAEPARVQRILGNVPNEVIDRVVATARGADEKWETPAEPRYDFSDAVEVNDTIWYHGSGRVSAPDSIFGRKVADNLVGPGIYLTDAKHIAKGYAKKRGGEEGSTWATKMDIPSEKVIDLEKPASTSAKQIVSKFLADNEAYLDTDAVRAKLDSGASLLDVYQEIRMSLSDEGLGLHLSDADEIIGDLNIAFVDAGFVAFRHKGGKFVGKDPHNVLVLLDPFAELGPAATRPSFSPASSPSPVRVGKLTRAEQRSWVGRDAERAIVENRVAAFLATRQSKHGDALTKDVLTGRITNGLAVEYAKGADIFPYLRDNRLSPPNRALQAVTKRVANWENDWARSFVTRYTIGQVHRAPTAEIEIQGLNTLDRVMDAAMLISQDAAWAWNFRNRWATATSEMKLVKLADELDAKFKEKFATGKATEELGFGQKFQRAMGNLEEPGGQALAPAPDIIPGAVVADTKLLTEYGRGSKTKQAVPDTVYQAYMHSLHRSALWAPYRIPDANILAKGLVKTKNLYRLFLGSAHSLSTPLRQWTVAMGAPMLFQKHAITDSFRTGMEEGWIGEVFAEAAGLRRRSIKGHTVVPEIRSSMKRRMDKVLGEISPTLRDEILYGKARVHASEAQWLSGTRKQVYRPKTIRDADAKIIDLDGSATALRRITQGQAFKQWSAGGEWAVREWLTTKAGREFLREGGWSDRTRTIMEEGLKPGETLKGKGREIVNRTREDYIETIVHQEFDRLSTALPNIMPELQRIALNDKALSVDHIKKLIEDNPTDNAVLSSPAHELSSSGTAGYIVGKAMAANKWNRDVVFDHVFLKQYRKLTKEGIEPDMAARAAATVAELNTSRIHFDLSNALAIEARHRWLAWFATKHRLYGTYTAKLAIERPMIAGAAMQIADWMAERNERLGVGEFDKYDLTINIGDGQYRFNLAPIMWFSEYPLDSSAAIAFEKGAAFVADKALGMELHPSPTPFGMTFTRADSLIITLADVMSSDKLTTAEELQKWLNALPGDRRSRWNRLINNQRAYAIAEGQDIGAFEAFQKVRASALKVEFFKAFKFYSGRKVDGTKLEVERLLNEFAEVSKDDPEAGREMMKNNPVLSAALNASMDPVEKDQLDDAFRIFNQHLTEYEMELEQADKNGTLIYDYRSINEKFRSNIDKLTNPVYVGTSYNPIFAKFYGDHNPQEFIDALGILMPLVPSDSVWSTGRKKMTEEIKEQEAVLRQAPEFTALLDQYSLSDADKDQWIYKMIEEEYVTIPLAEWTGENPYDLVPYMAQSVARYLARGSVDGPYKAQEFSELVGNQTVLSWLGAGIGSNGKPSASKPMMGMLSAMKQDAIGWNVNPETRQAWFEVAKMQWALELWRREQVGEDGKMLTRSSKAYQDAKEANMAPLIDNLKRNVPSFANEWDFSQKPMHERMMALGVGQSGTDEIDVGMGKFLNVTSQMWDELATVPNKQAENDMGVTTGAGAAGQIVQKYMKKVAALAKENKRWWYAFHSSFSLSKFGYNSLWNMTDKQYQFLYEGDPNAVSDEDEDNYWVGD